MDGTQYAIVSRNAAEGIGSFWFPQLSPSWYRAGSANFMEQPPLFYWLESTVFRLVGDTIYAERIFCLICLLMSVCLLRANWRIINHAQPQFSGYWWLPATMFLVTPTVFWSFRNNMIEMVVTVMVLATSYFSLRSIIFRNIWMAIPAALFLFFGSLCKGIPALFPMVFPLVWYVTNRRNKTAPSSILHTGILIFIPALIYTLLIVFSSQAAESLKFYFFERLIGRISVEPTVDNRLAIFIGFARELLVMVLLWLAVRLLRRKTEPNLNRRGMILFLLLSGFLGVAPLALTPVQRVFYITPAMPFFAMALAVDMVQPIDKLIYAISNKTKRALDLIALASVLTLVLFTIFNFGNTSRDREVLADVHAISSVVPSNGEINASFSIYSKWDLQFYLLRYHRIIVRADTNDRSDYLLKEKNELCAPGYQTCDARLNQHVLCCSTE